MNMPLEVFIGSSGESTKNGLVEAIRKRLEQKLGAKARLRPWTKTFDLGITTIEGLEKSVRDSDFAIMVLTPDDLTISRKKSKPAPRDNVVFELGLFMGTLGRDRCFIVSEERDDKPELKLPSDLLGITTARFTRPSKGGLGSVLEEPCEKIGRSIVDLGPRFKASRDFVALQAETRDFLGSLQGMWWEHMALDDVNTLSFFRIEPDPRSHSVLLVGKSYDDKGSPAANWHSVLAKLEKDESKILYLWIGEHASRKAIKKGFHGFGEMNFARPARPTGLIDRGEGHFWRVDEHNPTRTASKAIQLRRVSDRKIISTMTSGSGEAVRKLVKSTIKQWDKRSRW
jgi:predicted nucleotide-binding protein with TIR-like domain